MVSRRQKVKFLVLACISVGLYYLVANSHSAVRESFKNLRPPLYKEQHIVHESRPEPPKSPVKNHLQSNGFSETIFPGSAAYGFNVFDRLYLWNGTFYVVTSNSSQFPPIDRILSKPVRRGVDNQNSDPSDEEMQFITPSEATRLFANEPIPIEGVSTIVYDVDQFMSHFYHWWGEIILGSWRVYSAMGLETGLKTPLPFPDRFLLPHINNEKWRDPAGVNGPLMRAAFPSSSIEKGDYWKDLIKLNGTMVFERAIIANRISAHKSPLSSKWFKMMASTMDVTAPDHYFEPIRQNIMKNILGTLPELNDKGVVLSPPSMKSEKPVVTYISRQGGGRRLLPESHTSLIQALEELEREGVCEVQLARMETLTLPGQLRLAARSTVIVGIHGNGLTHQLWMPPSARSTIIEILYPQGYVFDYEMLARNMGHRHYAVWNDTTLTYPKGEYHKKINYGKSSDFHGNSIPVHGPAVADVIRRRLLGPPDS